MDERRTSETTPAVGRRRASRERLEAALARIAEVGDEAIFTKLYVAEARAAADAADRRAATGARLGPLDGAIVSIKDLFDVAGEPTTAGSKMLRDAPPALRDAAVVARLRAGGAVILGKTNMTEFAYSGIGINPHWGTPRNAFDPSRIPGGSSSGAGVAIGLGIGDVAIGTDTGGSVRIPAALNGVVGFKPTVGRVSTEGAFPLSFTLDSVGPLAPTVQACADADAAIADVPLGPLVAAPLRGLRVAVLRVAGDPTEDAVQRAFDSALRRLEGEGAVVFDLDLSDLVGRMRSLLRAAQIVAVEAAAIHAERIARQAADFDPQVVARMRPGVAISGPDYVSGLRRRLLLAAEMDAALADVDCLALPTTPTVAPRTAELVADPARFVEANGLMLRNASLVNSFDLCAVSLPMPIDGPPAGFMAVARRGQDARLLSMASAFEAAGLRSKLAAG